MGLRSLLTKFRETKLTVEDVQKSVIETERECSERIQKLIDLDEEFSTGLAAGADEGPELTRQSMELKQLFVKFRAEWNVLVERLRTFQFLLVIERVIPDETNETTPIEEVEGLDTGILGQHRTELAHRLFEILDRDEVGETVDRISDTAEQKIPFREQLVTAVLDYKKGPAKERSLDAVESIESNTNERRERMAELLRQEKSSSVHLWDLLAEFEDSGSNDT